MGPDMQRGAMKTVLQHWRGEKKTYIIAEDNDPRTYKSNLAIQLKKDEARKLVTDFRASLIPPKLVHAPDVLDKHLNEVYFFAYGGGYSRSKLDSMWAGTIHVFLQGHMDILWLGGAQVDSS